MNPELTLSFVAIFISVDTLGYVIVSALTQRKIAVLQASYTATIRIERRLGAVPAAFRLQGLDTARPHDAGVTPEEFFYVSDSFVIGAMFHRTQASPVASAAPGSFRRAMSDSDATRRGWPIAREFWETHRIVERLMRRLCLPSEDWQAEGLH